MGKVLAGKTSDIKPGTMKMVHAPGKDPILLANVGGKFYAMNGLCHHQEGPLWEGELNDKVVTCPWHGSQWDVTDGHLVEFAIELEPEPTYKVSIEGEEIFIEV